MSRFVPVCDKDCFNCSYDDCILDDLDYDDYKELAAIDKELVRTPEKTKLAAQQRAYREANKEKLAAQQRAYYQANKEKLAARQRAYYQANKEKLAAQQRDFVGVEINPEYW